MPLHFSGASPIHADGYAGYEALTRSKAPPGQRAQRIVHAACWAHARRKLYDVHQKTQSPIAFDGLRRIGALYDIERDINGLPPERRHAIRAERTVPLLADLRTKHIAFMLPFITVVIEVEVLRRARLLQRTYIDLACFVNGDGLTFVWKAGVGRLRLKSRKVVPAATRAALEVPIPPPVQHQMPAFAGAVNELAAQ